MPNQENRVQGECPSCGRTVAIDIFYEQRGIPIHSCLLVTSRAEALSFPVGDLRLAFCAACGFIWNTAFEPERMRYSVTYEETQIFSDQFREFQTELVHRWIERFGLRDRRVLEVGCGKGDFLIELCKRGGNQGTGIDPSFRPERTEEDAGRYATFLQELYDERHTHLAFDFVCCRHTLEHIPRIREFMRLIRLQAHHNSKTIVAFDLPDVSRVLTEQAFWDLYYEHCSYFSLGSLGRLFRSQQLEILDLYKVYADQYLVIEARLASEQNPPVHPAEESIDQLAEQVELFRRQAPQRIAFWKEFVGNHAAQNRRIAIWGSGSKAVAFLSRLNLGEEISAVVDVNPHRHGKYLAGTGHEIVPPNRLREIRPDVVIAMNPIYITEIGNDLHRMELDVELVSL